MTKLRWYSESNGGLSCEIIRNHADNTGLGFMAAKTALEDRSKPVLQFLDGGKWVEVGHRSRVPQIVKRNPASAGLFVIQASRMFVAS